MLFTTIFLFHFQKRRMAKKKGEDEGKYSIMSSTCKLQTLNIEKQTEPQVEEMILNYMRQVNRPYSLSKF